MISARKSLPVTIFVMLLALFSCKDDETPIYAVFGEPDGPIVYNLSLVSPTLINKGITLANFKFGSVRLVNNTFIIYEPGPEFSQDVVDVLVDGQTFASVVFISIDNDEFCNIHAKPLRLEVQKNSALESYAVIREYCRIDKPDAAIISATPVANIEGNYVLATVSGNVSFLFEPALDFTGYSEVIYEVGYAPTNFHGEYYESEAFVSGLVMITVVD